MLLGPVRDLARPSCWIALQFCPEPRYNLAADEQTGDVGIEAVVAGAGATLEGVVRDEERVGVVEGRIRMGRRGETRDPGPVYIGEAEPGSLVDGPEIPGKEQKENGQQGTDPAERLEAAIAEVETGVTVIAIESVAVANYGPQTDDADESG